MRDNVGLDVNKVFEELGISDVLSQSGNLPVFSPADGKKLASVQMHTSAQCDAMMSDAEDAFKETMKDKVAMAIDTKKQEIAKGFVRDHIPETEPETQPEPSETE